MSLFPYLFDNELFQRRDIERLRSSDAYQRIRMRSVERKRADLERDIAGLTLYCRTAVSLMIERGLITREEFVEHMHAIDLSDGVEDGRVDDDSDEDAQFDEGRRAETD
ncbi:MAG: hypothetical protein HZA53_11435 [Planctomycetes bacterium]|nr:hypothetical protein [Planctomycetota bacterium]